MLTWFRNLELGLVSWKYASRQNKIKTSGKKKKVCLIYLILNGSVCTNIQKAI